MWTQGGWVCCAALLALSEPAFYITRQYCGVSQAPAFQSEVLGSENLLLLESPDSLFTQ